MKATCPVVHQSFQNYGHFVTEQCESSQLQPLSYLLQKGVLGYMLHAPIYQMWTCQTSCSWVTRMQWTDRRTGTGDNTYGSLLSQSSRRASYDCILSPNKWHYIHHTLNCAQIKLQINQRWHSQTKCDEYSHCITQPVGHSPNSVSIRLWSCSTNQRYIITRHIRCTKITARGVLLYTNEYSENK